MSETHAILQRQRELVVQAGNEGTLGADELAAINDEIGELNKELTAIADRTEFNGKKLLDGNFDAQFQIGANEGQNLELQIETEAGTGFSADDLGVSGITATGESFDADVKLVDDAIKTVSAARSHLGANQNRLDHTINNLDNAQENLTAAESRIRDVDYSEAA
ncbi:flagellin [Virgibacillus profundi]|uniref:flagellin n=1 Tax=Virgibacillus profundi TaxID=2024555 RepID=UPI0026923E21